MIDVKQVKGIIFDYGGTIDSNGVHWFEVFRQAYGAEKMPVSQPLLREAYVHAERHLWRNPIVLQRYTFADIMRLKVQIQFEWLEKRRVFAGNPAAASAKTNIARYGYEYARRSVEAARGIISALARKYPLVMVSNFYGNLSSVLDDFRLRAYFPEIIESAAVGVRKPDPRIFETGIDALHLPAGSVVVIGDSYDKDIVPATGLGCRTVWLKNIGWKEFSGDETADVIISDFAELRELFLSDVDVNDPNATVRNSVGEVDYCVGEVDYAKSDPCKYNNVE